MGFTKWAEAAVFKGFRPNELIFGTEIGLLTTEPWLLSIGFANWSPHSHVDPQLYLEAGYYTEHQKSSSAPFTLDFATKRSWVTPTTSTNRGEVLLLTRRTRAR